MLRKKIRHSLYKCNFIDLYRGKIKEQKSGANLKFWVGTTAEYNALPETESGCYYILTDDTTFDDMESAVNEMQASVAEMRATIAGMAEPNKVLYGGTAILSGDTETPVEFHIPHGAFNDYSLYEITLSDTGDLDTATDVQRILIYKDRMEIVDDHFTFLHDNKINRIEESPELANSLRAVSYDIQIYIEGATQTQSTLSLICNRVYLNLTSRTATSTKYYMHELIGVI